MHDKGEHSRAHGAAAIREQQTEEARGTGTVSAAVYWKYLYLGNVLHNSIGFSTSLFLTLS